MSVAMTRNRPADPALPVSSFAIAAPFQVESVFAIAIQALAIHCAEVNPGSAARREYTRSHLHRPNQNIESRVFSLLDHRGRNLFRRLAAHHCLCHHQLPRFDANLGEMESEPHSRAYRSYASHGHGE